jgi:hypothetical protein
VLVGTVSENLYIDNYARTVRKLLKNTKAIITLTTPLVIQGIPHLFLMNVITRAGESESEEILGGVGVAVDKNVPTLTPTSI